MLYYILPPFIIILSAGALIMFLFRKMENVPAEEIIQPDSEKKSSEKIKAIKLALGQFGLGVLERIMHRLKLLALKTHNASNELFHSIREKRKDRMKIEEEKKQKQQQLSEVAPQPEIGVLQVSEDDRPRVKEMVLPTRFVNDSVRAMMPVSSRKPRSRAKEKMEESLIRRIAINPRDIEAYERLGDYYMDRENFNDSLECFKQVLKLSPAHHKAKTRIRKLESMLK